ncbi:MAG: S-methyl-5'-thioadenosine phosphorylase [Microlunatus sp.]|nr:S-methyl-5'-thioadenosine phosphorylase [Microlunatus sp.]
MSPRAEIAIIGGSGFYSFLDDPEEVRVQTPYGDPSAALAIGRLAERDVAFVPRHGARHEFAPHRVNYRANLWALRSVGVRQVLAPAAVGSLRPEFGPGTVVVPDQVVARPWGRAHTVYDQTGPVVHVAFADPYCPRGRRAVVAARDDVVDGGTLVVVNGPRFSSQAESVWHASQGWSLVGMTGQPEAAIARELALCYTSVALVTDHDAGVESGEAVTHAEVLAIFGANIDRLKELLTVAVAGLPAAEADEDSQCSCRRALDGMTLPFELP